MSRTETIAWDQGSWLNTPAHERRGDALVLSPGTGTDFWRHTSYGFVHDDGPALLAPLPVGSAMEVDFTGGYTHQFDQAGILLRATAERWVKAGVEYADGVLQLGAVVTDGRSDWSVSPVPGWAGRPVTVRVSRGLDSITVRARAGGPDVTGWQLVRVAPFPGGERVDAGPYACAPTRAGFEATFLGWRVGAADAALHA